MGERTEHEQREALLEEMQKLICTKVNDGVKLAYLTELSEEQLRIIDELKLDGLTEFKRNSNGSVEVKFIDRMDATERIFALTGGSSSGQMEALFAALGGED